MRHLLVALALLLAVGAPAALPTQAAPLSMAIFALTTFTSYPTTTTVSNVSPHPNSRVTVSGSLKSAGKPTAGVPRTATGRYKTTTSFGTGVTNTAGVASCSRKISWSDRAVTRSTPALLGLYSLITRCGLALYPDGQVPVAATAWYDKRSATFSDILASVRQAV